MYGLITKMGKVPVISAKERITMYKVRLESFSGNVANVELPSKEAVDNFLNEYPNKINKGVAIRVSCDTLGIQGTLIGRGNN